VQNQLGAPRLPGLSVASCQTQACDRRWWDIDLYPELAASEGAVGISASPEPSDVPVTKPGGIVVHHTVVVVVI
jgi:hypothetical protein